MTGELATMLVNGVIIVLLAVTIGYCWLLNKRIKVLQDSRGELAQLLKHFDESTQRASESIIGLQTASRKIGETIQNRIDKANYLIDDLSFMIEKGNKLANQIEAGFAVGRAQQRVSAQQVKVTPKEPVREEPAAAPEKPAEKEAAPKAQEGRFQRYELPAEDAAKQAAPQSQGIEELREVAREAVRNPSVLEEALTRVMNRNRELQEEEPPAREPRGGRVRSRSEQELLDLIKSGIKG